MKGNILLYYPSNKRTIAMETLMLSLKDSGYNIILLTTCEKGDFHFWLEKHNIETYAHPVNSSNSFAYYVKQCFFLIAFCKKHKIDYLHSHLQHANIIAVFAQFFIRARCVIFRHHCNFTTSNISNVNRTEKLFDKIIHRLAKKIIVPSMGVKNEINIYETNQLAKYSVLPYIYDFSQYAKPDPEKVKIIKQTYHAELILLFSSRFIEFKRPFIALNIAKRLIERGLNIKLLILDDGPLRPDIEQFILTHNLSSHIFIIGFRKDYIDFFEACDVLIHPSLTDASNSTVKEMALLKKVVITCSNTGDFDEYIVNGQNGFLVDKENTENEMIDIITKLYENKSVITVIGSRLREDVLRRFSNSKEVVTKYINETL